MSEGVRGIFLEVTASTNDDAKQQAREGAEHGTFVVADQQTAGRGRGGSRWFSPPGANLYFSILLRPQGLGLENVASFALAAGTCVAGAVEQRLANGERAGIKWPNDVQVRGRKIAGLLLEASHRAGQLGFVVVGVGLNVATKEFPPELVATSLALEGVHVDRRALAEELAARLCDAWSRFEREGLAPFLPALAERDVLRGKRIRVEDVSGVAAGVDARGQLLLATSDGELRAVSAGHVEPLGQAGC